MLAQIEEHEDTPEGIRSKYSFSSGSPNEAPISSARGASSPPGILYKPGK